MNCRTCKGTGRETRHRSRWIGGGRNGYRSQYTVELACERCEGSGIDPFPTPPAGMAEVIDVAQFTIEDCEVNAPGFERDQFVAFVARAKAAQLRTAPSNTAGVVMVQSNSDDARYAVRRDRCECQGHMFGGKCYHRALVIHLADVEGVNVCEVPTIGVNTKGQPVTYGRKVVGRAA